MGTKRVKRIPAAPAAASARGRDRGGDVDLDQDIDLAGDDDGAGQAREAHERRGRAGGASTGAGGAATGAVRTGGLGRKSPVTGPKRTASKRTPQPQAEPPEPSSFARELAVGLAAAGIDKKALGIEILDVTGKIDYADFLVIMTGRSDRHVQAIANGLEEAMRQKKLAPLSIEGLAQATWVLIDFGDVVVHVFQEDARRVYDIEGLWIDAGRVPVPSGAEPGGLEAPRSPSGDAGEG